MLPNHLSCTIMQWPGTYPRKGMEQGTPWMECQSFAGHTHAHNLLMPIHLTVCGRNPEYPEETQTLLTCRPWGGKDVPNPYGARSQFCPLS